MADPRRAKAPSDDVVKILSDAADAAGIPRLLLAACCCAESGLDPFARRPANAADDQRHWPDVSGGVAQQTVRWDPDYSGDSTYPGEQEIERVLKLQYDVARSARIAAANLHSRYRPTESDAVFKALCRYNWPAGNGAAANASVAANYRRGISDAQALLGADPPPAVVPNVTAILNQVIALGKLETGKPYSGPIVDEPESSRWGDPGWDCSSFVSGMYSRATNGAITLTAFTDAAHDQCEWDASPLPGDIVFYHYADDSQPGVTFPHMGIWLNTSQVLDCRYPMGVGIHDHVTPIGPDAQGRYRVTMRPKGLASVVPAPAPAPAPPPAPPPVDPRDAQIAALRAQLAAANDKLGVITVNYAQDLENVLTAIRALKPPA